MTVTDLHRGPPRECRPESAHRGGRRTRAGILNVWRYYDEMFDFHQGRLLLRGPNGTGKSKALELLLPYLFDASLRPNRLSTFGGTERTMHWNLMGEGASGTTRVGYVWLEFAAGPADDRTGAGSAAEPGSRRPCTRRRCPPTTSPRTGRVGCPADPAWSTRRTSR